jgi:hypothetical protein
LADRKTKRWRAIGHGDAFSFDYGHAGSKALLFAVDDRHCSPQLFVGLQAAGQSARQLSLQGVAVTRPCIETDVRRAFGPPPVRRWLKFALSPGAVRVHFVTRAGETERAMAVRFVIALLSQRP